MKTIPLELTQLSEAPCGSAKEPEVFFPQYKSDLDARKWDVYCGSCPIKQLCAEAVYEGFTGIAGGEFVGKLTRLPEPPRERQKRKARETPSFHKALGKVIREKRLSQGYGLRQFALMSFMSASTLSEFERGLKEVSSHVMAKIAETLSCRTSSLVRDAAEELSRQEDTAARSQGTHV